jgi:isoquinoline 1-oxidoreductase alpha subunit
MWPMAEFTLNINGASHKVTVEPDTPLLWVLRDALGLTGTKFGCGIAQCGACVVHMNGEAVPSCAIPVSSAGSARIGTIEGLGDDAVGRRLQQAWVAHDVPQCGYCQSGMLMQATILLRSHPHPSNAEINAAMSSHVCRCGTYQRIREAIETASRA